MKRKRNAKNIEPKPTQPKLKRNPKTKPEPTQWPCKKCFNLTNIKNAQVCNACAKFPPHKCCKCGSKTSCFITEELRWTQTKEYLGRYPVWDDVKDAALSTDYPIHQKCYEYFIYAGKHVWEEEKRGKRDNSKWMPHMRFGESCKNAECIRIVPYCYDCVVKHIPVISGNWQDDDIQTRYPHTEYSKWGGDPRLWKVPCNKA